MSIDLSFTKDPEWIKQRDISWETWARDFKGDFNKKEIADMKQYFMTGIVGDSYGDDSGKLHYFPLQTPEGWDYVFQNIITNNESSFKYELNLVFQEGDSASFLTPYELAKWDYFLGETFEPTITSRVPIAGEKVVLELDPFDVFCRIAPGITGFLERGDSGDWPKWIQRADYFWSLWLFVTDDCFDEEDDFTTKGDAAHYTRRLINSIICIDKDQEYDDPNQTRPKFLKIMEEKLDELYPQLCPKLQALWDETKAKKATLTK